MMKREPAFPTEIRNVGPRAVEGFDGEAIEPGITAHYGGMTLRDYFAAKAMQAFCGAEYNSMLDCSHWAKHAYMMADAMLAERAK